MLRPVLALAVVAFIALELVAHVESGGCYRFVPYGIVDRIPSLPASSSFCVLNEHRRVPFAIDSGGARRASNDAAGRPCRGCVIGVGDSQVLGYIIPYDETFTALYAASAGRDAALVAAPSDDLDTERLAVRRYVATTGARPETAIVTLNFGNDLDEMFLGRRHDADGGSPLGTWLAERSVVYDIVAGRIRILARELDRDAERFAPGANPVAFALAPDDRPTVVTELANAVAATIRATGARHAIAVVIPPDVVVDPHEFEKYRAYYSTAEYADWTRRLPAMAAVMSSIETGVVARLRASGTRTIDVGDVIRGIPASRAFDRSSHHLSPLANRLVATAIR